MKNTLKFVLVILLFLSAQLTFAQDFKPEVKIGGVAFTGFQFNIDNADFFTTVDTSGAGINGAEAFGFNPKRTFETSRNSFYMDRAYINIRANLSPQISARITPDIYSFKDGDGKTSYAYRLKYASFDYTPLTFESGASLSFSLGIIPNQWINNVEKYYGYRGVAKTLTDYSWITNAYLGSGSTKPDTLKNTAYFKTGSYFSSADLGMTAKFTFPKKYADLYVSVYNGNGYTNLGFDNRFKDIMVTGFIYPLAGELAKKTEIMKKAGKSRISGIADLTVGGFVYIGKLGNGEPAAGKSGNNQNRFGGMLNFKYNFDKFGSIKVGGEFSLAVNKISNSVNADSSINARGISAFMEFNPPLEQLNDKLFLTARYDTFNPNTDGSGIGYSFLDNGKQSLLIVGLMYKPVNMLTLGMTFQRTSYGRNYIVNYDGTSSSSTNRMFVNAILDF